MYFPFNAHQIIWRLGEVLPTVQVCLKLKMTKIVDWKLS